MPYDRRQFLHDAARLSALASAAPLLGRIGPMSSSSDARRDLAAMTIAELARLLATGTITSRALVEQSLAAIADPNGEGARTFLLVHEKEALAAADRVDARRRAGAKLPMLAGIPISIKDLFDEAGVVTRAGSTLLAGAPPATRDSVVVERLKGAGVVIVGRTNMTEFAYSGLGLNPHYGTPKNTFDRAAGRIPGGSSSGAAISVSDGMCAGAIGTDTGGSVRIPGALNGLVGFKPTARRVPRDGVFPLSTTLDSVGPIAKTVADCALLDRVLAAEREAVASAGSLRGVRFGVPTTLVQDDLAPDVASAFRRARDRLAAAGATVTEVAMPAFGEAVTVDPRSGLRLGALLTAEAFALHRRWLHDASDEYDPRVSTRLRLGEAITTQQYDELVQRRERFIRDVGAVASGFDALLMPTTPETAPTIAEAGHDDATYVRLNGRMLRNTSLVNMFDGCALTIPCHDPGSAQVGVMIAGTQNTDRRILSIGLAVENVVRTGRE